MLRGTKRGTWVCCELWLRAEGSGGEVRARTAFEVMGIVLFPLRGLVSLRAARIEFTMHG
jgi:hypothetical protein